MKIGDLEIFLPMHHLKGFSGFRWLSLCLEITGDWVIPFSADENPPASHVFPDPGHPAHRGVRRADVSRRRVGENGSGSPWRRAGDPPDQRRGSPALPTAAARSAQRIGPRPRICPTPVPTRFRATATSRCKRKASRAGSGTLSLDPLPRLDPESRARPAARSRLNSPRRTS